MPIVFVHGVNNRNETKSYSQGIARKTKFITDLLAPALDMGSGSSRLSFPYWGKHGASFQWNQACVPGESERANTLAIADADAADPAGEIWLRAVLAQTSDGAAPSFGQLSRDRGFSAAVDLIWDIASVSEVDNDSLLKGYAAALAYVRLHPVPTWAMQDPPLSNSNFVDTMFRELRKERNGGQIEVLGFGDWLSRCRESIDRWLRAPINDFSSTLTSIARSSVHASAARFLGDIFVYLDRRGDAASPGPIVQTVAQSLHEAQDSLGSNESLAVIGHSLGGVVAYDVLTHFAKDVRVDAFISVGSQVALFEEIKCFRASDPLIPNTHTAKVPKPDNVVRWLNVYDRNDVFSFLASPVFTNVEDFDYDTGYGLAGAHGGYFERPSFYRRLAARLATVAA